MFDKIANFLKSDTGVILISIIWGLGLACIFKKSCKGSNCIIMKAPSPNKVKSTVYKHEDKCYQYIPMSATCNANPISQ